MAATLCYANTPDDPAPVKAYLSRDDGGQVAADPAGYIVTSVPGEPWLYSWTVAEACVGLYRLRLVDGDGITQRQGWLYLTADDAGPYTAEASRSAALAAAIARAEADAALAAYDGPTKAELDAAQASIEAAIAALNNLSAATVRAQVDSALVAYDPATGSEVAAVEAGLAADIAALENLSASSVRTQVDGALALYDGPTKAELDAAQASIEAAVAAAQTVLDALQLLAEADQRLETVGAVKKLKTYQRGTSTELIPAKTAIRTDGVDLSDPATEKLAGYRQD